MVSIEATEELAKRSREYQDVQEMLINLGIERRVGELAPFIILVRALGVRRTGTGAGDIKTNVFFCLFVDEFPDRVAERAKSQRGKVYQVVDREETFLLMRPSSFLSGLLASEHKEAEIIETANCQENGATLLPDGVRGVSLGCSPCKSSRRGAYYWGGGTIINTPFGDVGIRLEESQDKLAMVRRVYRGVERGLFNLGGRSNTQDFSWVESSGEWYLW